MPDKLPSFRNIEYDYSTDHDVFIGRGLQLNMINDNLNLLIDEVDALGGGGSYTIENGLTEAADVIKLGGTLTGHTTIDGDGSYSTTIKTTADTYIKIQNSDEEILMYSGAQSYCIIAKDSNYAALKGSNSCYLRQGPAGVIRAINLGASGMIVDDDADSKGLTNAADYSGQWTDHSLVTKKWVEDNFVGV
jgi:hypothetical protein